MPHAVGYLAIKCCYRIRTASPLYQCNRIKDGTISLICVLLCFQKSIILGNFPKVKDTFY
jgi:hypothetical protein